MDNGYWTKFEVKRVKASEEIPHGIRYSLTLHDRNNNRVFGIDNAHGFKPKRKRFGAKRIAWDHQHRKEKVLPYEFESPVVLLTDFWKEVDRISGRLAR
jgi:hypothetical protein